MPHLDGAAVDVVRRVDGAHFDERGIDAAVVYALLEAADSPLPGLAQPDDEGRADARLVGAFLRRRQEGRQRPARQRLRLGRGGDLAPGPRARPEPPEEHPEERVQKRPRPTQPTRHDEHARAVRRSLLHAFSVVQAPHGLAAGGRHGVPTGARGHEIVSQRNGRFIHQRDGPSDVRRLARLHAYRVEFARPREAEGAGGARALVDEAGHGHPAANDRGEQGEERVEVIRAADLEIIAGRRGDGAQQLGVGLGAEAERNDVEARDLLAHPRRGRDRGVVVARAVGEQDDRLPCRGPRLMHRHATRVERFVDGGAAAGADTFHRAQRPPATGVERGQHARLVVEGDDADTYVVGQAADEVLRRPDGLAQGTARPAAHAPGVVDGE